MARPLKEIDQKTFEGLCRIHATQLEMCEVLGVNEDTINTWCKRTYKRSFSELVQAKRAAIGNVSLRRQMWDNAINNNNTVMQIWLSKQYLGHTDKVVTYDPASVPVITDSVPTVKGEE